MYINKDDVFFARYTFGDFVNGEIHSIRTVAVEMARHHRYIQSEMFKICVEYLQCLAGNYKRGYYDGRNEWACEKAHEMLEAIDLLPTEYNVKEFDEINAELARIDIDRNYKNEKQ